MGQFYDRKNVANNWTGTSKNDDMRGAGGDDIINGAGGADYIMGGSGDDTLVGGAGDDRIWGNGGTDSLTGGTGRDYFIFNDDYDSRAGDGIDTITDFKPGEGDQIDFRGWVSDGGDFFDPIYLVETPTGTKNELTLTYDSVANRTVVNLYQADADGNTVVDNTFYIIGQVTTTEGMLLV